MMFGERVKTLRKERKMTQAQLAEIIGVTKGTVALWEQGARKPSLAVVNRLSDCFDRSVDYILGNSDDPTPKCMDSDYLAMSGIGDEYGDLFADFLLLDDYGKELVTKVIRYELKRCKETKTLCSEFENDLKVQVYFKPEVAAAAKVAPHNPVLDRSDASEDFEVLDDDEN